MQKTRSSKDPRKQRKFFHNAPPHIRHKFMGANVSSELAASKGAKTIPLRKGDTVRIMRGDHKGFEGKVSRLDMKNFRVYLEGLTREKVDGTTIFLPIHPSKVQIRNLNLDDKWRKAILERKVEINKAAEKTAKPTVKKKAEKPTVKKAMKPKPEAPAPVAKEEVVTKEEKPEVKEEAPIIKEKKAAKTRTVEEKSLEAAVAPEVAPKAETKPKAAKPRAPRKVAAEKKKETEAVEAEKTVEKAAAPAKEAKPRSAKKPADKKATKAPASTKAPTKRKTPPKTEGGT
jgi:large subunit ribosomal protein L24